jgi:UDP-4-amino-4,6-dideoxy-N-acetyl-beta-L-altrosamine N-acetyltransferase
MEPLVSLRKITSFDTSNIVKWRNNPSVRMNLFSQEELTEEKHLEYFQNVVMKGKCEQFIICVNEGSVNHDIGTVFIKNIDRKAKIGEYGIFIGDDFFRGRGFAYLATREVLRIAFLEMGLDRVYLSVMRDNIPGIKMYEKAGFVQEEILEHSFQRSDGYVDIIRMGISKEIWFKKMEAEKSNI